MAGCCGGKNAGKPISRKRYALGMAFFAAYHAAVGAALTSAGVLVPRFRPVRDFHRRYFLHLWQEAWRRKGIHLDTGACRLDEDGA
ncbi:MAG: hypothetical protein FJ109_04330 [Deltaproteobacteria bacterium]|nr:hypothetical protein [Deltaproteobacteria bacterium]